MTLNKESTINSSYKVTLPHVRMLSVKVCFSELQHFYCTFLYSGNSFLQALSAAGLSLVSTETNLVDQVWEDHGRPDPPNEGLIVMDMSYTGQ